jgi:methylenetetrahydrofolate reductase (NADPH)
MPQIDSPTPLSPTQRCPKQMQFGPCGAVTPDGGCELPEVPRCPFIDGPGPHWEGLDTHSAGLTPAGRAFLDTAEHRPVVIVDFPAAALDARGFRRAAEAMCGSVDAALMGDHGGARVQFPPSYRALLAAQVGFPVWAGLNCRDRNRVALEGELAALADADVVGVHCVTGDHTRSGHRPDAQPVFDLDSTRLAALARQFGVLNSVAERPDAPPIHERPARLAQKIKAGGRLCILNHTGSAAAAQTFIEAARAAGANVPFIASVAVVTSHHAAAQMAEHYPDALPGRLDAILCAADPREAGLQAALELSRELLDLPGVIGVDLSGGPLPGQETEFARDLAELSRAVRRG